MREELEHIKYLDRKRDFYRRQLDIINVMPKLIIPFAIMLIVIMLLEPGSRILGQYERIITAEANGMEKIPDLRKEISILEKQVTALSTASIESRLKKIEGAIKAGDIDTSQIATLQELKSEFEILKSYMFNDPKGLVELKTLQRDYRELIANKNSYMSKYEIQRELSFLTNMFYTVLGFLGLLVSIASGSWWFTSRKIKTSNDLSSE